MIANSILAVVVTLLAVSYVGAYRDQYYLAHHSLRVPLLEDYSVSGMHFWSFGSSCVVTNDYARLVPAAPHRQGYLWNRHPNTLPSWSVNVSVRANPGPATLQPTFDETVGLGIWYVMEPARFQQKATFYGVPPAFTGVGIVLQSISPYRAHLVFNSGEDVPSVGHVSRGSCYVTPPVHNTVLFTLSFDDEKSLLSLYVTDYVGEMRKCAETTAQLPLRYYFGATASTSTCQFSYDILEFIVHAQHGATEDPKEFSHEMHAEFDAVEESIQKKFWREHGDDGPMDNATSLHPEATPLPHDHKEVQKERDL